MPVAPPAAWFAKPKLDGPMPVRITKDGRVYGHVAAWDSCHIGFSDRCVRPPKGDSGYGHFRTAEVITAEGTVVKTGPLIIDSVHPNLRLRASDAQAFYAHTGSGFADVAVYDDEFGIVIAGAVRPTASPEQMRTARGSDWSPDWREIGGRLRMVACLAVNNTGFKVPALAASAGSPEEMIVPGRTRRQMDLQTGRISALVAAGMVRRADTGQSSMRTELAALREQVAELSELTRPMKLAAIKSRIDKVSSGTTAGRRARADAAAARVKSSR
jgi:hypothetical protein